MQGSQTLDGRVQYGKIQLFRCVVDASAAVFPAAAEEEAQTSFGKKQRFPKKSSLLGSGAARSTVPSQRLTAPAGAKRWGHRGREQVMVYKNHLRRRQAAAEAKDRIQKSSRLLPAPGSAAKTCCPKTGHIYLGADKPILLNNTVSFSPCQGRGVVSDCKLCARRPPLSCGKCPHCPAFSRYTSGLSLYSMGEPRTNMRPGAAAVFFLPPPCPAPPDTV